MGRQGVRGEGDRTCQISCDTQWGQVYSIHLTVKQAKFMRPCCQFCCQWLLIVPLKCTFRLNLGTGIMLTGFSLPVLLIRSQLPKIW